jgi:hypothetical protein
MREGMLHEVATKQEVSLLSRALGARNALFRHDYRIFRAGGGPSRDGLELDTRRVGLGGAGSSR